MNILVSPTFVYDKRRKQYATVQKNTCYPPNTTSRTYIYAIRGVCVCTEAYFDAYTGHVRVLLLRAITSFGLPNIRVHVRPSRMVHGHDNL